MTLGKAPDSDLVAGVKLCGGNKLSVSLYPAELGRQADADSLSAFGRGLEPAVATATGDGDGLWLCGNAKRLKTRPAGAWLGTLRPYRNKGQSRKCDEAYDQAQ